MASNTPRKSYRYVCLCEVCHEPLRLVDLFCRYWVAMCTKCGVVHEGQF